MWSKGVLSDVANSLRRHGIQPKILFDSLDSNRSGLLLRDDLYRMALAYRPNIDPVEFDELFWQVNRSCSGEISFTEFCGALGFSAEPPGLDPFLQDVVRRIHNSLRDMDVKPEQLFRRLDANAANLLGPSEIGRMVRCFNQQLNKVELDNLFMHFSAGTNAAVDLRMFCRALGFPNSNVNGGFGAGPGGAAWERIAQVARSLQAKCTGLQAAFQLFDSDNDGYLDRDELHRLLSTCDPSINQRESDDVFYCVATQGQLRFQEFAQAMQISSTPNQSVPRSLGAWMRMSPPSKLDPSLRSLAQRISAWLEPALLSQCLQLEGQSRISRVEFDQIVHAMEPQLRTEELDRLFQQAVADSSGGMVLGEFVRRFGSDDASWMVPGPGTDQWALALLRRLARRAASALSAPQDLFKKHSITASGMLSQQEFGNMLRDQFPDMTPGEVDSLWNLADADRSGQVDVYEFSTALRFLMLEAQDTTSSMNNPPALGSARDQVIEARIAQLARRLGERSLSLAQAFLPFDIQGTGFIDRVGFKNLLGYAGMNLAEWEVNEIIAWFDTARDGRINHLELVRWFDVSAQARAAADAFSKPAATRDRAVQDPRVALMLERWKEQGATLHDAFRFFDCDKDGNLDCQEFFRLMITCDPKIDESESNTIFARIAGPLGQLGVTGFAKAFSLSDDYLAASTPAVSSSCLLPQLDPAMYAVVNRMNGWLEPAMLSRTLGVTKQSCLSRDDFNRVVLAVEPRLSVQELDRLFLQANAAGAEVLNLNDFVRQFTSGGSRVATGPEADQWALALVRRVATRINLALEAPEDVFRKSDVTGDGNLSHDEFERMVRMQDNTLTVDDIEKLWRLADRNGDGQVDLQEFCSCLRYVQLEAQDTKDWATGPPAALDARDRVVEVRMAQLARCCSERGVSLAHAFRLYDPSNTGFIDRISLQRLMESAGLKIADWEVSDIVMWGDTARDGRLNYRELIRQLEFFLQGKATADLLGTAAPSMSATSTDLAAGSQPPAAQSFWQDVAGAPPTPGTSAPPVVTPVAATPAAPPAVGPAAVASPSTTNQSLVEGLPLLPSQLPTVAGSWRWISTSKDNEHRKMRLEAGKTLQEAFKRGGYAVKAGGKTHKANFKHMSEMLEGTRTISVNQGLPSIGPDPKHTPKFEYGGNPIESARKFTLEGYKTVTVNAASAFHAGGGFTSGGRHALEEAFCSQSTLYPSLEKIVAAMGGHRPGLAHIPVDGVILSPHVELFRGGTGQGYPVNPKVVKLAGVVSMAMFNRNPGVKDAPVDAPSDQQEYEQGVSHKMQAMVHGAILAGADALIVPDVGCGVFKNDPGVVGRIAGEVLKKYQGYFRRIMFTERKFAFAAAKPLAVRLSKIKHEDKSTDVKTADYKVCPLCKKPLGGDISALCLLLGPTGHLAHGLQFLHTCCADKISEQWPECSAMTLPAAASDPYSFLRALDVDGNGILSKDEVYSAMSVMWSGDPAKLDAEFETKWKMWDTDSNGYLDVSEVAEIPKAFAEWLKESAVVTPAKSP